MRGSLGMPFAAVGTLLLIIIDVTGHLGRDSGNWLLEPATPTLIKTCTVIVVLWYAGFAAFVMLARYREAAENDRQWGPEPTHRAPIIPLPNRRSNNPPTQPIPVPPPGEVGAVNE